MFLLLKIPSALGYITIWFVKMPFFADQTPFFAPLGWHSAPHEASAFPTKHWQSSRTRFAKLHLRPVIDWMKYHKSVCQEETRRNNKA